MPLQTADYHRTMFNLAQTLGAKVNASAATFVPIGYEQARLLLKQFPRPIITGGQEIETFMPGGGSTWEQGPIETKFQGAVSAYEHESFPFESFQAALIANGGYFDGRIYEGTPESHVRSILVRKCFIKMEPVDRDIENRGQVVMYSGTMFGNFFGEFQPGNIA